MTSSIGLCLAAVTVISALVLAHPLSILVVTIVLALVFADLMGNIVLWDLDLNSISMINLVMAVGLVVDYSSFPEFLWFWGFSWIFNFYADRQHDFREVELQQTCLRSSFQSILWLDLFHLISQPTSLQSLFSELSCYYVGFQHFPPCAFFSTLGLVSKRSSKNGLTKSCEASFHQRIQWVLVMFDNMR